VEGIKFFLKKERGNKGEGMLRYCRKRKNTQKEIFTFNNALRLYSKGTVFRKII
jgi:hypothetical protein